MAKFSENIKQDIHHLEESLLKTEAEIEHVLHDNTEGGFFSPETNLLVLTWIVFVLLLLVLKKYAWGPILTSLDTREKELKEAITNADKLKEDLAKIDSKRQEIMNQAEQQAKQIIEHSRKAAMEVSDIIKTKAKEEAQILLENAQREIKNEKEKALSELKKESAHIVVELAGKLINENLDSEKNRRLINDYIKEI